MLALVDSPYNKTTDAVYSVYYHVHEAVPGARFGGGYTFKPGFHSSVNDNLEHWPGNYSIRDAINRRDPKTVGRALDATLSNTEMVKRTRYLAIAAAANDPRLACVREFYGTLNNSTVFGRAHDGPGTAWRSSSADSSHLWHIHLSFFTPYTDDWDALAGVVSVLKGESLDDYMGGTMAERNIAEYGDTGTWVDLVQRYLQAAGAKLENDGIYKDETTAALKWWFVNVAKGNAADYNGRYVSGWIFRELLRRENAATAKSVAESVVKAALASLPSSAATPEQIATAVAEFFGKNPPSVPATLTFTGGTLSGVKAK